VVGNIGSEQRAKYAIVGSAVNVAARVEGATVGGQVFLTEETYIRIQAIADVTGPVSLDAKGLSEPLRLYDLRVLRGRFARGEVSTPGAGPREVAVSLPMTCRVIDGKVVRPDPIDGEVVRLAGRQLVARLATPLAPLTNVRLRLRYSVQGPESDDMYGKVVGVDHESPERWSRIHLTSTSEADARRLEELMR
jgi:adenylate cyclase